MGKKHKKHGKSKEKSKKRRRSRSSTDDSSSEGEWAEKITDEKQTEAIQPPSSSHRSQREEWMNDDGDFLSALGGLGRERPKDKRALEKAAEQSRLEEIRRSRELNPYMDRGGLPQPTASNPKPEARIGDGGSGWLRRALQRAEEQARTEGRSLEEVAAERWGSLEKLHQMLAAAEQKTPGKSDSRTEHRHHQRTDERHSETSDRDRSRRLDKFMQPSDASAASSSKTLDKMAFARPRESSMDDHSEQRLVKAKPINPRHAKKLGDSYNPKDFVTATDTYKDLAADNADKDDDAEPSDAKPAIPVQSDEMNRISAKILKAEIMGDTAAIQRLKAQLESLRSQASSSKSVPEKLIKEEIPTTNEVILTKFDHRTGATLPVIQKRQDTETTTKKKTKLDIGYDSHLTIKELVEQEKTTSAEDQLSMFGATSAKSVTQKVTDEWTIDDVLSTKKRKAEAVAQDSDRARKQAVQDFKRREDMLADCAMCIDGYKFQKHLVVATGLKTYLCVPWMQSLVENHCYIVPMGHVASSLHLDEDIYDEMKIWRKGLVAMFEDMEEDCVFVETAKNVEHQRHMYIECIPMPREVGEMAPIYFKKAILESDEEWAQNKRLIDLQQKPLRRSIPKGFSYFAVDFGLQSGFAHVIENETLFPSNFAREIIGGMLDLDHRLWRKPSRETFEQQTSKMQKLKDLWTPYDWSERAKAALR